jgi:hypothetical protein
MPLSILPFPPLISRSEHLLAAQDTSQKELDHLNTVLDDLDQLGDIMGEILQNQESVEVRHINQT